MAHLLPGAAVDVSPNAHAPLAPWATDIFKRGRYERGGRGPDLFDCMGIVTWAQAQIGRLTRDYLDLYRALDIEASGAVDQLMRVEASAWRNVEAGAVGDVLVLGTGERAHHVAVLCGEGHAIHAMRSCGIVIHPLSRRRRLTRFDGMKVFGCVAPA